MSGANDETCPLGEARGEGESAVENLNLFPGVDSSGSDAYRRLWDTGDSSFSAVMEDPEA